MEQRLNQIYTKTYNYVYLRAKSILKKENDIQQLMRDIYLKMLDTPEAMQQETMYEWLGKAVYAAGCSYYRKKQAREADCLEMNEQELDCSKKAVTEESIEVIESHLEDLPDLYQATLYAFYYDYMSIEDIAALMDCTEGIVINRLNYARKYMIRVLEDYHDDTKVDVAFSVGNMRAALRKWSVENCMGVTMAQSVYSDICALASLQPSVIEVEGKEFAGVNHTVVYHKADDWQPIIEQVEAYGKKKRPNKNVIGVIVAAVVVIVLVIVLLAFGGKDTDKTPQKDPVVTEEMQEEEQQEEPEQVEPEQPQAEEPVQSEPQTTEAEYIFPESATRKLTREEIESRTKAELRLGRNEIYARYGVIFEVEDLDTYFGSKSWYQPKLTLGDFYEQMETNEIEEANITLIKEIESSK